MYFELNKKVEHEKFKKEIMKIKIHLLKICHKKVWPIGNFFAYY